MDSEQLKALEAMFKRRTDANTASPREAREWILRDGVHHRNGFLINPRTKATEKLKPAK